MLQKSDKSLENNIFVSFLFQNIWQCNKFVVPLHPKSKNNALQVNEKHRVKCNERAKVI